MAAVACRTRRLDRPLIAPTRKPGRCLEGSAVGPFSQRGLDKALRFAVGLWTVGFGPDVFDFQLLTGRREGVGFIAWAIISHHPAYGDSKAAVPADSGVQVLNGAVSLFIIIDLGECEP